MNVLPRIAHRRGFPRHGALRISDRPEEKRCSSSRTAASPARALLRCASSRDSRPHPAAPPGARTRETSDTKWSRRWTCSMTWLACTTSTEPSATGHGSSRSAERTSNPRAAAKSHVRARTRCPARVPGGAPSVDEPAPSTRRRRSPRPEDLAEDLAEPMRATSRDTIVRFVPHPLHQTIAQAHTTTSACHAGSPVRRSGRGRPRRSGRARRVEECSTAAAIRLSASRQGSDRVLHARLPEAISRTSLFTSVMDFEEDDIRLDATVAEPNAHTAGTREQFTRHERSPTGD